MASKSSPLAFLPTPVTTALPLGNENLPPLSPASAALPDEGFSLLSRPTFAGPGFPQRGPPDLSNGQFSPLTSPTRVSPSNLHTNRLPHHSSTGQAGVVSPKSSATSINVIPASFVDQSRAFLEQQRHVFDQERLLFAQERALWDTERQALYARVRELELAAEGNNGGRKYSEYSMERTSIVAASMLNQQRHHGSIETGVSTGIPAGIVHRSTTQSDSGDKFWEGASSRKGSATRTFSPPKPDTDDERLPSISESGDLGSATDADFGPPSLSSRKASGNSVRFEESKPEPNPKIVGNGIDISLIEKDLDGITLKASALPSSIITKLRSPPTESPHGTKSPVNGGNSGGLSPGGLDNLTIHAGHTPVATGRFSLEESGGATPKQPEHLHRPSVAYSLTHSDIDENVDEDPILVAPLGITNDNENDEAFLSQLDLKLLDEAKKIVYAPSSESSMSSTDENVSRTAEGEKGEADKEPEIKIRFKRSMNFGSAFGSRAAGF